MCSEYKRKLQSQLRYILEHDKGNFKNAQREIDTVMSIDKYLMSLNKPKSFKSDDPNNALREFDRNFENIVASLEDAGVQSPKNLTVLEFRQRVKYYKTKNKTTS